MTLPPYDASRKKMRLIAATLVVDLSFLGCEVTPGSVEDPPLTAGQDRDGAVAAVAEVVFKESGITRYKEPFFLDVEGVDPSESLRRRIKAITVRELSEADDGDPRRVWIADVTATGDGAFEMSASYGSIVSKYCAKLVDGQWNAERCGLTLAID